MSAPSIATAADGHVDRRVVAHGGDQAGDLGRRRGEVGVAVRHDHGPAVDGGEQAEPDGLALAALAGSVRTWKRSRSASASLPSSSGVASVDPSSTARTRPRHVGQGLHLGQVEAPCLVEARHDHGAREGHAHPRASPDPRGRHTAHVDRPGVGRPWSASQPPARASAASAGRTTRVKAGPCDQSPTPWSSGGPATRAQGRGGAHRQERGEQAAAGDDLEPGVRRSANRSGE